jgi:hypothetical protein
MVVCALSMGLAAIVAVPAPAADAQTPTPPPRPALNDFGGPGPCGIGRTGPVENTSFPNQDVWLFQPSGTATPTRTGGTCGGTNRPVALIAHGWTACSGTPSIPEFYLGLVNNLVSNGFIVVYPNYCSTTPFDFIGDGTPTYDMVDSGFRQALGLTTRESTANMGVWGHSFGGGMAPWLAEQITARNWGTQSLWVAVYAPYVPLRGSTPFAVHPHTRGLNVIYEHDTICVGIPFCNLEAFSSIIYQRMPAGRVWGVRVRSDCSHPPAAGCNPPADDRLRADHFTPTAGPPEGHLQYYGSYRNVHRLYDCARNAASPSCSADRTFMGRWSDGVEATRAQNCTATACT